MNFYIGDTHFGHKNALDFDNRPFADVDEMERELVRLWNSRVEDGDHVYVLGDFAFRNQKAEQLYLEQLKGIKHLIIGNHDDKLFKNGTAMKHFASADKMLHVSDGGREICLCHFPIADWNGFYRGHYHIYAHIHARTDGAYKYMRTLPRALNAGCMINGYMPVGFDELVRNNEIFKEKNG